MGQMRPRMMSSAEVDASVSYRLVGLYDCESDEEVPTPRIVGHPWLSVGVSRVMLESADDIPKVRFCFEWWDGRPPFDPAAWPLSEVVGLYLPSGRLGVSEFTGHVNDVFQIPVPGRYRLRLAWRAGARDPEFTRPEAFALAQFWAETADRA